MTDAQQLAWWREATGRHLPATVEVSCEMTVGRCVITTVNGRFPSAEAKAIITGKARKSKPRSLPKAACFATLPGGYDPAARVRAAWRRSLATGQWAA